MVYSPYSRILLRWKRSTKARGVGAVEELANALRGMGRHDLVAVLWEAHHKNIELAPACFAHLDEDMDTENSKSSLTHMNAVNSHQNGSNHHVSIRQIEF